MHIFEMWKETGEPLEHPNSIQEGPGTGPTTSEQCGICAKYSGTMLLELILTVKIHFKARLVTYEETRCMWHDQCDHAEVIAHSECACSVT